MRSIMLLLCAALTLPAHAHGIWFAQRAGKTALIYGEGSEDLDVIARIAKVRRLTAYNTNGMTMPAEWIKSDRLLFADADKSALVATTMDNGLWTKTAEGKWLAQSREGLGRIQSSGHYLKYAVHWNATLTTWPKLPDQALQLKPEQLAVPTQKESMLTLTVLFNGQPVKDATVVLDLVNDPDAQPLRSDAQGRVSFRIRNQGLNVIAATWKSAAPAGVAVDFTEHLATLSFVLPHAEE
jgi:nickel transport protein